MSRFTVNVSADQNGRIGFYGCIVAGRGRIVRCHYAGEGKPPHAATVECPVCGSEHLAKPSWRKPIDADAGQAPDLVIGGEGAAT